MLLEELQSDAVLSWAASEETLKGFMSRATRLRENAEDAVVLGIETSCDDTAVAVLRGDGAILGQDVASQHELHEEWGGVVPSIALEAHKRNIERTYLNALDAAGLTIDDVDLVAVTVGPGLEICLRVGTNFAKGLCQQEGIPFMAVHHLEAHCLMARHSHRQADFPFLALLVSGGHCQMLLVEDIGRYSVIGGTIDDALGEAYDKVARMLGLPATNGGGPALERAALSGDKTKYPLPVPMQQRPDCDFSYAGLKTSVRTAITKLRRQLGDDYADSEDPRPLPEQVVSDLAASFQESAIKHLEQRLRRALKRIKASGKEPISQIVLAGGVAANKELRRRMEALCEKEGLELVVPNPKLCTDNGVMIAWAAIERLQRGQICSHDGQEVQARVPLGPAIDLPSK